MLQDIAEAIGELDVFRAGSAQRLRLELHEAMFEFDSQEVELEPRRGSGSRRSGGST